MIKILSFILFSPHLFLFLAASNKEAIVADLYSRSDHKRTEGLLMLSDLSERLFRDRYFRTLFYFRTSGIFSKFLRVFYPREKFFIIDVNTKLGKGVQLAHPYSTILNAEIIGENVYINHLVTVGEKNGKRPIIGNNVQLHAGAIVIGDIKIGDDVIVGAGTVVTKDVPSSAVVVGNPARILSRNV